MKYNMAKKKPKNKPKVKAKKPVRKAKIKKIAKRAKILVKKKTKKIKPKVKIQRKIKKIVKRPVLSAPKEKFSAESLFKAKIKVIGIGGGGGSIVSEIRKSLSKATFVIADTDIRALKKKAGIKYFWFGQDFTHGLGTGVDVDLAKRAAESAKEKIGEFFKDQDIVIFVASLGGGLGSGASQIFAEVAKEFGGITLGIFTMPFKFEGKNKQKIAQNALKSLRQLLNVSLVLPNERIFKIIDSSTPIVNAFSTVNKSLIESLESLIDLIYNPGIINIDFADLRTILSGRGNSAFINTIEESGKDRAQKICENIFKNPLLQTGNFSAEKILFNISGGDSLSMFEVEKISSHIGNLNPKAKIIFGISKSPKLKNRVKTTILMTGAPVVSESEEKVSAKTEKVESKQEAKTNNALPEKTKPEKSKKTQSRKQHVNPEKNGNKTETLVPINTNVVPSIPVLEQKEIKINQVTVNPVKKTVRRNALEIKKAEELEEKKKIAQEKEWEIPAFLRKIKFKS